MELERRENLGEKRWNWRLFVEGMELGCTMCSFFLIVKKVGIGGGWNHVWIGVQLGEDPVVPISRAFGTRGLVRTRERGNSGLAQSGKGQACPRDLAFGQNEVDLEIAASLQIPAISRAKCDRGRNRNCRRGEQTDA